MIQYILNVTGIWLLSLLLYDLLLRRESYHGLNRAYLWLTLLTGFVLPLYSGGAAMLPAGTPNGITDAVQAKRDLGAIAPAATASLNWENILTIVYVAGAGIALLLLLKEAWLLLRLYWQGQKTTEGGWTIIETARTEAPFSFGGFLFVADRQAYTQAQWQTILHHETQHRKLWHGADLLLLQLLQVACWFHPLVYMYRKRLVLVHEYQADEAVANAPQDYARFLLQQAGYAASPRIAHSFNQSPLKNRITMLTKTSTFASKGKLLLALPMLLLCMALFTKVGFSEDFIQDGDKITYRGNVIEMSKALHDTMYIENPATGAIEMRIVTLTPRPLTINGNKIHRSEDVTMPATYDGTTTNGLQGYLFKKIQLELNRLPDGEYSINVDGVVIDKTGKVAFFSKPMVFPPRNMNLNNVDADTKKQLEDINKKITDVLNDAPKFTPAQLDGQPVAMCITSLFELGARIKVKNNVATF